MPPKAESSNAYRDKDAEEDDDDFDDLDASFNKPNPKSGAPSLPPRPKHVPDPSADPDQEPLEEEDEDFDASLVEGMESLLRQLAGDHPPGPMPGTTSTESGTKGKADLSPEEEEKAFQKAIEMMLSTEGMAAMGLNDKQSSSSSSKSKPSTSSVGTGKHEATSTQTNGHSKADVSAFEETIRKAMESLNSAGGPSVPGAGGGGPSDPAELAKLLAQLGNDPNLDLEGDDELSGILDGMMGQLMTREVLEEPLSELASKYPEYLASPPKDLPSSELEKYRAQYALVQKIVDTFRKPGYSDDKDGKEIARLVGEMQDLGGPPGEIMGELPEGFDLSALAGDDACTIM